MTEKTEKLQDTGTTDDIGKLEKITLELCRNGWRIDVQRFAMHEKFVAEGLSDALGIVADEAGNEIKINIT